MNPEPTVGQLRSQAYINSQQPQPDTNQPSFLQKLIPTGLGILGGIGGTLLGGPVGGIAGAGLGGAVGKGLENASEGQNPLQANDITSGLENAGGQAVGGVLGSIGGKVLGAAAKPADNLAVRLLQGSFKGGEKAMSMNPNEVASQLYDQGVTNPADIPKIAGYLTGRDGAYNQGIEAGLKTAATNGRPGIDVNGMTTAAQQAVNEGTMISPAAGNKILGQVQKSQNTLMGGDVNVAGRPVGAASLETPSGALGGDVQLQNKLADPQKVFDEVKQFEGQAYEHLANRDPESQAIGKAYQDIADSMKEPLFAPGGQPIPLTQDLKNKMLSDLAPLEGIHPGAYDQAKANIQDAEALGDLRNPQALWVNANNGITAATNNSLARAGTSASEIAQGTLTAATNPKAAIASLAVNSPTASKMGPSVLSRIADIAQRAGKFSGMAGGTAGVIAGNLPNDASPATNQTNQGQLTGQTMNTQPQGAGGSSVSPVSAGINDILTQLTAQPADAQTANYLAALGVLAPQAQKNLIAAQAASAAPAGFANAGGAQGLGGILTQLTGVIPGTPANAYDQQQALAQATLGQALGVPAGATSGVLPGLMQNQQTAGIPQSTLQGIIQSLGGSSLQPLGLR